MGFEDRGGSINLTNRSDSGDFPRYIAGASEDTNGDIRVHDARPKGVSAGRESILEQREAAHPVPPESIQIATGTTPDAAVAAAISALLSKSEK